MIPIGIGWKPELGTVQDNTVTFICDCNRRMGPYPVTFKKEAAGNYTNLNKVGFVATENMTVIEVMLISNGNEYYINLNNGPKYLRVDDSCFFMPGMLSVDWVDWAWNVVLC